MIPCSLATCPSTLQCDTSVDGKKGASYALAVTGLGHFGPGNCFSSFMHLSLAWSEATQIDNVLLRFQSIGEFRDNLVTEVFHKRGVVETESRLQQEKRKLL